MGPIAARFACFRHAVLRLLRQFRHHHQSKQQRRYLGFELQRRPPLVGLLCPLCQRLVLERQQRSHLPHSICRSKPDRKRRQFRWQFLRFHTAGRLHLPQRKSDFRNLVQDGNHWRHPRPVRRNTRPSTRGHAQWLGRGAVPRQFWLPQGKLLLARRRRPKSFNASL